MRGGGNSVQGVTCITVETPHRKRQRAKARKRQEAAWAKRSGTVVTYIDESIKVKSTP